MTDDLTNAMIDAEGESFPMTDEVEGAPETIWAIRHDNAYPEEGGEWLDGAAGFREELNPIPYTRKDIADKRIADLNTENIRLKNDCDIILANLDSLQDATGESLEWDDASVVEQIRSALKSPTT